MEEETTYQSIAVKEKVRDKTKKTTSSLKLVSANDLPVTLLFCF